MKPGETPDLMTLFEIVERNNKRRRYVKLQFLALQVLSIATLAWLIMLISGIAHHDFYAEIAPAGY